MFVLFLLLVPIAKLRRLDSERFSELIFTTVAFGLTFVANYAIRLLFPPEVIAVDPADPARYRSATRGWFPVKDLRRKR